MRSINQRPAPERLIFRPEKGPAGDVLVVVFLRGGMDALYAVPPHGDDRYFACRPAMVAIAPGRTKGITDLDGLFGLHPQLAWFAEAYREKHLAIVHACGSPDSTLSHFHAMQTVERGVAEGASTGSGWLARHLASHKSVNASPMRAIAFSNVLPTSLQGAAQAQSVNSLSDLRLSLPAGWNGFSQALGQLYAQGQDPVARAGRGTLQLMKSLERLQTEQYRPEGDAEYPPAALGRSLGQVAQLIKADVGLEVACLESHGWDSHLDTVGALQQPLETLATSLCAFYRDLGDRLRRVVIVVMSEFGRRAHENSAGGTDHGRGTAMFVMGGGLHGGKVYGQWPGLADDRLDRNGNLSVTTDYRSVLAEIVDRRLGNARLDEVFPGFTPRYLNLAVPRQA